MMADIDEQSLFTIEQVATRTGFTKRTLRYYEEVGLLPPTAVQRAITDATVKLTSRGSNALKICAICSGFLFPISVKLWRRRMSEDRSKLLTGMRLKQRQRRRN